MRIKVADNFYLDEFIDVHTYFNSIDNGLSLIDHSLFSIVQELRNDYGDSIGINNWWHYYIEKKDTMTIGQIIYKIETCNKLKFKGKLTTVYKWSGLRTSRCKIGAPQSAHKLGQAIDPKGPQMTFFNIIKNNAKKYYQLGVRRLEDIKITPGWLHIDTLERNTQPKSIRVVDRTKCTETIYF